MKRAIVWFRNDLRLHDHGPLRKAIAEAVEVIPVFVFDENKWRLHQLGFPKTGSFQTRFILESVNHLKESLQQCGADLIIRKGILQISFLSWLWNGKWMLFIQVKK